jgi:hypothetical protein
MKTLVTILAKSCSILLIATFCFLAIGAAAEASPLCAVGHGAAHFAQARAAGVQRRHQNRVARRQSGRGLAKLAPRNW